MEISEHILAPHKGLVDNSLSRLQHEYCNTRDTTSLLFGLFQHRGPEIVSDHQAELCGWPKVGVWPKVSVWPKIPHNQLAESGRLAENTRYQLAEIGRLAESGRLVENTKHQSTELAETRQRVYLTKVGDWPKEPTDDRADRRKSRLTSGKEACSGVLIVEFWSKWS